MARLVHLHIPVSSVRNTLCNIGCVCCYSCCYYSFLYVICIRQAEVFGRSNIAEKCCSVLSCNGTSYS